MDGSPTRDPRSHRPGAVSAFFVYKAGLFALGFWVWLAILVFRGLPVSGWHILSATGAATATLVGVVLGARYAIDRAAAQRYDAVMRSIVELSWYSFAPPGAIIPAPGAIPAPARPPSGPPMSGPPASHSSGDAEVIHLPQESRHRQNR